MNKFYSIIERAVSIGIDSALVMFSSGKDSIVTLDLCHQYIKNIIPIYLFYIEKLNYREDFIKYYEDKYGIEIKRFPHPELLKYYKNKVFGMSKKYTNIKNISDNDNYLRNLYNISYIAYGYKRTDNLSRNGMIWYQYNNQGIDQRNKKIYPVALCSDKDIFFYIKQKKLKLSVEYENGFRDINTFFKKNTLSWLKDNYYEDYLNVKKQFPLIEAVLLK